MCGRYLLRSEPRRLAKALDLSSLPLLETRYNIAPGQPILTVARSTTDGTRIARHLRWGLVPQWADDPTIGHRMINARSETVADKPSFAKAVRRRRCLVPADGFYEWRRIDARTKQPHVITLADEALFAMAGIFEHWQDAHGNELETCAILTCEPNELMATLHDRMPVILAPDAYERWLDCRGDDASSVLDLLRPYPAKAMRVQPVSDYVNSTTHEGPRCIEPAPPKTLF